MSISCPVTLPCKFKSEDLGELRIHIITEHDQSESSRCIIELLMIVRFKLDTFPTENMKFYPEKVRPK